jgi:hypothetical protein
MLDLSLGTVLVPTEDGYVIDQNHARIAEIIKDYDPDLELAWIPPDKRLSDDPPFCVIHRPVGLAAYIAFYSWVCDETILERIFMGDVRKQGNTILSRIDAKNAAIKALQMKRQMDQLDEASDKAKHILRSPQHNYTVDGVVYHDNKPATPVEKPKIFGLR